MKNEIQPIEIQFLGNIKYFSVKVLDYKVGEIPEDLEVILYDEFHAPVHTMKVTLTNEVYEQWGTDDSVLVEWVAEAISVTLV
jgi:hypothetical protein